MFYQKVLDDIRKKQQPQQGGKAIASSDQAAQSPSPLSGAGSYGEGGVQDALQRLEGLKSQLLAGSINSADFMTQASPLVKQAQSLTESIAGKGSNAASAVNPIWQKLQSENFVKSEAGQWTPELGLSDQEYANLPDSAKPTADQLQKNPGLVTALPQQAQLNQQITNQQGSQQNLFDQARQTAQSDQANTQKQLQDLYSGFLGTTKTNYDQAYKDIAGNLQQQQDYNLKDLQSGPGGTSLKNYYNNLGLMDSGAFNSALATNAQGIEQNTQEQLLQAQLQEQQALQSAAQQGIGALGQFGVGAEQQLQDISNQGLGTLSGLGTGGLQRQFSLEDFYNQATQQRQLADMQNNTYLSAIGQQQMNPWTQLGLGFAGGVGSGIGQGIGKGMF